VKAVSQYTYCFAYRSDFKTFNCVQDHVSRRSLQAESEGGVRWITGGIPPTAGLIFRGLDTSAQRRD